MQNVVTLRYHKCAGYLFCCFYDDNVFHPAIKTILLLMPYNSNTCTRAYDDNVFHPAIKTILLLMPYNSNTCTRA